MTRLTPEREAEIRELCDGGIDGDTNTWVVEELLAEIDALREENEKLKQEKYKLINALAEETLKNDKLLSEKHILGMENEKLKERIEKLRIALEGYAKVDGRTS